MPPGNVTYEIFRGDDSTMGPVNPYDLLNYDMALVIDTPAIGAVTAFNLSLSYSDHTAGIIQQGVIPSNFAVYVAAIYGTQLGPAPLKPTDSPYTAVRAFCFSDELRGWLAADGNPSAAERRSDALYNLIASLSADVTSITEEALIVAGPSDDTLH